MGAEAVTPEASHMFQCALLENVRSIGRGTYADDESAATTRVALL
jgi:hypothetical protein